MAAHEAQLLRPLGVGDLLDELFALYRRGFKPLIGIAAVVHVPLALVTLPLLPAYAGWVGRFSDNANAAVAALSEMAGGLVAVLVIAVIAVAIGSILELAATCYAVSALYLGEPVRVGDAYRRAIGRFWPLFRLVLLLGLALFSLSVVSMVPVFAPALLCLSLPAAFALAIFMYVHWSLAVPALALEEGLGAAGALSRSYALVKGAWWRTFAVLLVLGFLLFVLQMVASLLVTVVVGGLQAVLAPAASVQPVWLLVLNSLLSSAVNLLFGPFPWIGLTLLYYDRRVRTEGFDLLVQARALPQPDAPTPAPE
jgi:hypothetical protein